MLKMYKQALINQFEEPQERDIVVTSLIWSKQEAFIGLDGCNPD
jgi:hypothetical protein